MNWKQDHVNQYGGKGWTYYGRSEVHYCCIDKTIQGTEPRYYWSVGECFEHGALLASGYSVFLFVAKRRAVKAYKKVIK